MFKSHVFVNMAFIKTNKRHQIYSFFCIGLQTSNRLVKLKTKTFNKTKLYSMNSYVKPENGDPNVQEESPEFILESKWVFQPKYENVPCYHHNVQKKSSLNDYCIP